MGQTLTHGIYLPDEGERNCYAGLAANWQILDNSVGTIASHTSQIAGKAPAVHTHTKADITDFPAYGNAAGTICEGNDSRLSDARTPVAHTHTKSDVTDLFNSANTWSGENKYTSGFILSNISWSGVTPPSSAKPTVIEFKNSDTRQGRYINRISSTSSETWIETIRNVDPNTSYNHTVILKVDNSGNKSVYPSSNNDIDLGTSTSRWKTLNGINPGALSLPDIGAYTDLTSNIPSASLDGITNINLSSYITSSGWLSIVVPDINADDFVFVQNTGTLSNRFFMSGARGNGFISLMMPINIAGQVIAQIKASSVSFCRFYPGLGNV